MKKKSLSKIIFGSLALSLLTNLTPFHSQAKDHCPTASGKIAENLYAVKAGMTNFYVVTNGIDYICIDAGSNLKRAKQELHKLKIDPEKIQALFLTHSDWDHIAAISLFKNARIYLSSDEEKMVLNKERRILGFINNKLPFEYYLHNDGWETYVGELTVKVIATPGHTSGSMSYLVNGQILFTGDALSLKNGKAALFTPRFFNMDETTQKKSIKKMASLRNITLLCTGHHGFTDNFEFAMKEWRNQCEN
jgi:hydroxyacylglutathione hydrolase